MSYELSELVLGCGFESGARRALLEAIAHYADTETGLARVSLSALATRAALNERTAWRHLAALVDDPETDGLLVCVKRGCGRNNPSLYRLHSARLEPVRAALIAARRRIYAGAATALQDAKLVGLKPSNAHIRAVFACLKKALLAEQEFTTARTIDALAAEFELAAARHAKITVIGTPLPATETAPDAEPKPCQPVRVSESRNPDKFVGNPDNLTLAHSKDIYTSGNTPSGTPGAEPCGKILAGAASHQGSFLFDTEGVLAHAALARSERLALLRDLQGRVARVTPDGVLAIRCRDVPGDVAIAERWLERLICWASDAGLSGVVFDAEVRAPP